MEKLKLASVRKSKGLSQKEVAERLFVDVSTYNRKEKGSVKIRNTEWIKLSQFLNVPIEEIFEEDESHVFIFNDNSTGSYLGTNHIYAIPESLLDV
ncbi:MAG: XRE family transcriptional regulator, partial [Crocinitomicaceae bacterium]|nr:XRE family transcriptional regulator [Crocinitomicaceae bacterium]